MRINEMQRYLLVRLLVVGFIFVYTLFQEEKEIYVAFLLGYMVCWLFSFIGASIFVKQEKSE